MRILVRGTNWIGDAVMSVPALRELRRIFPDDHITLHARSLVEGVFREADFIDEVLTYEPNRWRVTDVLDNSRFLGRENFDAAILFPNSFESALTAALSRVPRRIGYNKDARGLLLTDAIAVPEWKGREHEAYYYLELVYEAARKLGARFVESNELDGSLPVSDERLDAARKFLIANGLRPELPIVALGVGSTNSNAKRWPAARFAELSDRLLGTRQCNVILLGSKGDSSVAAEVAAAASLPVVDLTGQTDVAEVSAILSAADVLVANDMGLAHIAPAVGTPTLVIFGPTDPTTTRPFSANAEVIRVDVECSPCMLRECPIDHRCMTRIDTDRIFTRVVNLLDLND